MNRAATSANVRMPLSTAHSAADDGREEERSKIAARSRRRAHELPDDEDDESVASTPYAMTAERVLQEVDDVGVARDEEEVLPRERIEVAKPLRPVVEEQDRERERERDGVRDREERRSSAVRHATGRVREGDVRDSA